MGTAYLAARYLCGKGGINMMNLLGSVKLEFLRRSRFLFCALTLAVIVGCSAAAPVKGPNISALYRVPILQEQLPPLADKSRPLTQEPLPEAVEHLFKQLYALNPSVALEVGKLPEFQGNIGERQILTLTKFIDLIQNATEPEKAKLINFMEVGKPASKKYCAPLEAIFWILERGKPRSKPTVQEIEYFQLAKIGNRPGVNPLEYSLEELLAQAWDFSEQDRWKDYETVTDRLNAPELVNYYERARFIYKSRKGELGYDADYSKRLFNTNRGNCTDHGAFTGYCLKKGGYKAYGHHNVDHHIVCLFENNGKKYILDNGRPDKLLRRGIIPFEEYEMYHDQKYTKKGGTGTDKDSVFWLQGRFGMLLVYLIEKDNQEASIESMCKDLGVPAYVRNARMGIKELVKFGFISITAYQDKKNERFSYKINEPLCRRFLKERYNKQQNEYPWIGGVNTGYYSSLR
jgi:hypothetical protein